MRNEKPPRVMLGIRVTQEIKSMVQRAAKDDRRTLTAWIELAIIEKLQNQRPSQRSSR